MKELNNNDVMGMIDNKTTPKELCEFQKNEKHYNNMCNGVFTIFYTGDDDFVSKIASHICSKDICASNLKATHRHIPKNKYIKVISIDSSDDFKPFDRKRLPNAIDGYFGLCINSNNYIVGYQRLKPNHNNLVNTLKVKFIIKDSIPVYKIEVESDVFSSYMNTLSDDSQQDQHNSFYSKEIIDTDDFHNIPLTSPPQIIINGDSSLSVEEIKNILRKSNVSMNVRIRYQLAMSVYEGFLKLNNSENSILNTILALVLSI